MCVFCWRETNTRERAVERERGGHARYLDTQTDIEVKRRRSPASKERERERNKDMAPKDKEGVLDPVRKHDRLNLFLLPWIALPSIYSTLTGHEPTSHFVVYIMIEYMLLDALYIALNPKAVPR